MRFGLLFVLLAILAPASAMSQVLYPPPPAQPSPIRSFLDGFALTAGFDWQSPSQEDLGIDEGGGPPFFIGGELRLPLCSWADVGGNLDREFTDAPAWKARAFVAARLWRR
jgi:hypothetical protein